MGKSFVILRFVPMLLLMLSISDAYIIHYTAQHHNETYPLNQEGYISCICDGQIRREELPKNSMDKIFQSIQNHNFCGRSYSTVICDLLKKCQNCIAETEKCTLRANTSNQYDCLKNRFEMQENFLIGTAPNGSVEEHHRVARQIPSCSYPTNLKTSDLKCIKYPSKIKCKQKCIFGHTLEEGISREMQCKYKEDQWKPIGFQECRPFVDCTMTLVSTGALDCVTGTVKSAPACNVSCSRYEDKPATPTRTYVCRITGAWSIKLPFCAIHGSGFDLVPAPRVKLHPEMH